MHNNYGQQNAYVYHNYCEENWNKYVSEYVPPEQIRGPEQIHCDTG